MSDTKTSALVQRWGVRRGYNGTITVWAQDCQECVFALVDSEVAAHIVQLHNAELDRKDTDR